MLVLYNFIKILAIILFFLPAFYIPNVGVAVFYVFSISLFFINVFFNKKFISTLIFLYKNTAFKYFIYFAIWIIFAEFVLVISGHYSIKSFFFYLIWTLIIVFFISYLLPVILFKNRLRHLIKVLIISNFFVYLLGIIQYYGSLFNINIITDFIALLANCRYLNPNFVPVSGRMYGIFEEPGWFGFFIFLNIPFLIAFFETKYKIFKNFYINFIFKKFTLPLALICSILTKSPIWLMFNLAILLYMILKKISFKVLLYTFITIVLTIIILIGVAWNNDLSSYRVINRILIVFKSGFDLNNMVNREASFANRILSYILTFQLFLKHWFWGTGLGFSKIYIVNVVKETHLPLTYELVYNFSHAGKNGMSVNGSFLWSFLAEIGILGTFLFYLFVYKTIRMLITIKKILKGIDFIFCDSLILSLIFFILVSWYDIGYTRIIVWFYIGCSLVVYLYTNKIFYLRSTNIQTKHK